ncbi:phBC6A51 family helix-turn-helix protein [Paenibacillus thermotolerans]|uniref:phBC6A51 family helix-turn-helix protein n=1 Tax=Paenibacillus thermotolerans TaxID=3027807 RepID=UPI002368D7B2|nr:MULTISPECIES: phBC6A51 family helix-turn-helix protein [unclassified Paenibacillus]
MNEDVRKNDQTETEELDPRPYMKGLTVTEIRAVELLARKSPQQSYREIANTLGISERHLRRIRDKRQVELAVRERALEIQSEDLPDVLSALAKKAKRGDLKAIEMYLVMQGINVNKSEVVQKVHKVSEPLEKLSDAELDAELEALKKEVMGGNVVKFHNRRKNEN